MINPARSRGAPISVTILVTLAGVVSVVDASPTTAVAQACEAMSGPDRTDCFIARAQLAGAKAAAAAAAARVQTDAAILRAKTGTGRNPKVRRIRRGAQAK